MVNDQKPGRGRLALLACVAGISVSASLNKLAIGAGMHPIWINALRLGIAVAVMLPFFIRKGHMAVVAGLPGKERWLMALSGLMLAVHFASWTAALSYADSVMVATIWSTFSLMTVLGSALLLHERTPLPAVLGILVATLGVGISAVGASGMQLLGAVLALLAALSQAVYTLCGRMVRRRVDTLPYTMVVYTLAFVCLLLCALLLRIPPTGMGPQGIGAVVALALICTLGGHSMQNYALRYIKAPTVSAAMLTEVFTGPLLVYLFFGEVPNLASVIGGVVILLGVLWYMTYEWRRSA